ncbi:trehalose corynomycolyl transferase C [Corynebacterium kutscheri]|uniref:Putative esterase n=1 Tax=Corynebacterium kutscheri TaxID=35755 RepID=A0A0F6TEK1_9CORY|nr:alpha/beta hydrolase-fold protein [Corynebacterium kutscheri]AKE42126.1 putative esterase [Corynebacterium kutscheri]VEH05929.1 trehalose corynomycolyl transferase C [Corynebacterium kutscheri]VEH10469.1 trehalose corynomycolyl transferase C [Corynebacterium kutscheri]VEH81818.1 trehalose corynomycolyl transferase C [Corynebacterium kutscheri]
MRDTAPRSKKRGSLWLAAAAVPTAIALGAVVIPATSTAQGSSGSSILSGMTDYLDNEAIQRSPVRTEYPTIAGLPAGVSLNRVEWLSDRRIALFINSAAMPGEPIQVQMLLARDWHSSPQRNFPAVWALDGLRAIDKESGWTINTNIEQQFADKNVNVILPIGGESSFYADWQRPDNGKNYKWETFLIDELIPVLRNGYRTNDDRAIFGLSMGGTAAINLAEHHPSLFKFVGSFSGYLDTTSIGMPQAIAAAQSDAGGYNANAMWGDFGSQSWIDHDPKLGIEALKNMSVYVSAGSGRDDYGEANSVARGAANAAGIGLEVLSRMTTQTFVNSARNAGVEVKSVFRPSGVHDWPYWQYELSQAWPDMANALGLSREDRGADCSVGGAIASAPGIDKLSSCTTNEYDMNGGRAQDFQGGRAYWSHATGAYGLYGRIGARYSEMGSANSWLGFPTSTEIPLAKGGFFVSFQNGNIYWTPATGAIAVPADILHAWGDLKWENGDLGYPIAEAKEINGGLVQQFQNGYVVRTADKKNFWVRGEIAKKYGSVDTANSRLGYPTSNEIIIDGGAFQQFEHGNVYWSAKTGAHIIYYGAIFDAWGEKSWERGEYGWPTTDQSVIPAGGETIDFEHGKISQLNGHIVEEKK